MTPKQKRAQCAQRWREVEEELFSLDRRKATLDPDEYNHQRVQLIGLRDQLERQMSELFDEEQRRDS